MNSLLLFKIISLIAVAITYYDNKVGVVVDAFINEEGGILRKVQTDFVSLTTRVTARHILVANEEIAVALKQKIRNECIAKESFVVDVFEIAAKKYSNHNPTKENGGLLGTLVPQGRTMSPTLELDRHCFSVPLGQVVGPLKTDCGYHLVLVSERTNCYNIDGDNTLLTQTRGDDVFGTLREGTQEGKICSAKQVVADQIGFWIKTVMAGTVVAGLSEQLVSLMLLFPSNEQQFLDLTLQTPCW
jgi:peptidyl-prolyl cis-trans isomerase C